MSQWHIWVDTGGTFTDCLGVTAEGRVERAKVLSSGRIRAAVAGNPKPHEVLLEVDWNLPDGFFRGGRLRLLGRGEQAWEITEYRSGDHALVLADSSTPDVEPGQRVEIATGVEAPILAAHWITRTPLRGSLPPNTMRLATTRGTNALLERTGSPTALFITRGFGDLLTIGNQQRPDLFTLNVVKAPPLFHTVVEVEERMDSNGEILLPLDLEGLRPAAAALLAKGVTVAAIALLHSYRNSRHEDELAVFLTGLGFRHVSRSAQLAPLIKIVPRAETAVVNAYLSGVIGQYLDTVGDSIRPGPLHVMTSAGSLVQAANYLPKDSLLSGPAGGVVGAAAMASQSGWDRSLAFDMGGTSTDVSRFDGVLDYRFETHVGDARLLSPSLAIETVAAGGGSICHFDGRQLKVGPQSAGADPGPACYGAGGPLTLTDVNLLLGRLRPVSFEIPIDAAAAKRAADDLLRQMQGSVGGERQRDEILQGLLDIANERMAEAVRRISIRQGYRPAEFALVAFGGAGGQHACALGEILDMDTVLVPEDAGLLSAVGLGRARVERIAERQILRPLNGVRDELAEIFDALAEEAREAVQAEGVSVTEIEVRRRLAYLRLAGQEASLGVAYEVVSSLEKDFAGAYQDHYGYRPEGAAIEVETLRVIATSGETLSGEAAPPQTTRSLESSERRSVYLNGEWQPVPVFLREDLRPGDRFSGPALVFESHCASVVAPGWTGEIDGHGCLILRRRGAGDGVGELDEPEKVSEERAAAIELELFTHRFAAVAWQMGEALRRTAMSVNVKDRLDFSCALLDPDGELVVNAPHIPVHLGAMGLCVRQVRDRISMSPGDVVVTNHPAYGGSHLPDVTLITPVYLPSGPGDDDLLGYVASRAHHAEIGGIRPGSMPPDARCLAEEGVVLEPQFLVRAGEPRWQQIQEKLENGPYPSRAVAENLADLRAAQAANHRGSEALRQLVTTHGRTQVLRFMRALTGQSELGVRQALRSLGDGRFTGEERLDDGAALRVTIELEDGRGSIDFVGSAPVHPGNLNATPAVVRSAVLYVLRLLIREPLPLNEGLLKTMDLRIPEGILNPPFTQDPRTSPAVVGGNVETSQRIVDTLIKALGIAACSQGTMNNVLFGNDEFGYYETVCGGCGAAPGHPGASAVHSHMTNTAITDPEIMEHRYPVRLESFSLRRGSGGSGRYPGGEGVIREITFLEPMSLSLLSQHRRVAPYGAAGGGPGVPGTQALLCRSGELRPLQGIDGCEVDAGDRLILETPGGGGWGTPAGGEES